MSGPQALNISPAIPILRIFDVGKAKEFFCDFLGFSVDWEHAQTEKSPLYFQVSRENMTLHLSEHHGDSVPGLRLFVPVQNLEKLAEELKQKNYKYAHPDLVRAPWGQELEVTDPFGNRLTFCRQESSAE